MDLTSMLNDGPPPAKKQAPSQTSSSPEVHRPNGAPSIPPTPSATGQPSHAAYASAQVTPLYGPPPSKVLTPLQTPSQAPSVGQYPFPQQPTQSPASAQHSPYGAYTATTPGVRPPSHGYHYPQPSPAQHQAPPMMQSHHAYPNASLSPTPPSHRSQTPHSVRQSPLSTIQQPPASQPHHASQPSTPLGPPPLYYQRPSTNSSHFNLQSPYPPRTLSSASTSQMPSAASPAQHHPSIGNLLDSPSAYSRPSPNLRRTSDYLSQVDRERSLSVSPKTVVPPRPPSLGSRQGSIQEMYSARSSLAGHEQQHTPLIPIMELRGHVPASVAQAASNVGSHGASEGAQEVPFSTQALAAEGSSFSTTKPQSKQHSAQKMGMKHLLTPADPVAGVGASAEVARSALKDESSDRVRDAAQQSVEHPAARTVAQESVLKLESQPEASKKRSADFETGEPPAKVAKLSRRRMYLERPIWARLARTNPLYNEQGAASAPPHKIQHRSRHAGQANGTKQQQPNGHPTTNGPVLDERPWQHDPPLDGDLIHARSILGQWEKTFCWRTPLPDLLKEVQDWLFIHINQLHDIGTDPREGVLEIEAKVGKIIRKAASDSSEPDARLWLPVRNMTVLDAAFCEKSIKFESQMEEHEHKIMNDFLNKTIRDSREEGRVPMDYKHPKEIDTFRPLSDAGLQALPPAFRKRIRGDRELKLRTSTDSKTGQILARIVKIDVAHLHIFNPLGDYDCRISINLEANLDRPDLHPDDLSVQPTYDKPAPADRKKDRLSYKHLACSIDLTRVDVKGVRPKYELEVEVDSNLLRGQMELINNGRDSAYGEVVSGFLDNVTFLMRQKRPNV